MKPYKPIVVEPRFKAKELLSIDEIDEIWEYPGGPHPVYHAARDLEILESRGGEIPTPTLATAGKSTNKRMRCTPRMVHVFKRFQLRWDLPTVTLAMRAIMVSWRSAVDQGLIDPKERAGLSTNVDRPSRTKKRKKKRKR